MFSEAVYQSELIQRLKDMFPGSFILKNDPTEVQGIPDILILYGPRWAMLEVKLSARAPIRPNQQWFIEEFDRMSFAAFVYPENEDQVLSALQSAFQTEW